MLGYQSFSEVIYRQQRIELCHRRIAELTKRIAAETYDYDRDVLLDELGLWYDSLHALEENRAPADWQRPGE
jgi:hypothetical protein